MHVHVVASLKYADTIENKHETSFYCQGFPSFSAFSCASDPTMQYEWRQGAYCNAMVVYAQTIPSSSNIVLINQLRDVHVSYYASTVVTGLSLPIAAFHHLTTPQMNTTIMHPSCHSVTIIIVQPHKQQAIQ